MHATCDTTTTPDHYAVLGLARGATTAEIQRAYLHLARKHHPDLQLAAERPAAVARFAEIVEARRVLSDPELRTRYDALESAPDGLEAVRLPRRATASVAAERR